MIPTFVNSGMLIAGLAMVSVPVLIHLIARRAYRTEPWAAMQFLLDADRVDRRRLRLERVALLLLRSGILLLLAAALARPLSADSSLLGRLASSRVDHVIVLDDSLSMQARRPEGSMSFERARRFAAELIRGAPDGDGFALVAASEPVRGWTPEPTRDRAALQRILDHWAPSMATDDLPAAIEKAREILREGDAAPGARRIHVLSDMTGRFGTESRADESRRARDPDDSDARLIFYDANLETRDNAAITAFDVVSQPATAGVPVRCRAELANFTQRQLTDPAIRLLVNGEARDRLEAPAIAPGAAAAVEFDWTPEAPGLFALTARLDAGERDALSADDQRDAGIVVPDRIRVLCVEGRPQLRPYERPLFYYITALSAAGSSDHAPFRVRRIDVDRLADEALGDIDVVVLGDAKGQILHEGSRLLRFVHDGGGLLVFPGKGGAAADIVAEPTHGLFGEWEDLSARHDPVSIAPPTTANPALFDFPADSPGGLFRVRITGRRLLRDPPPGLQTLLRDSDGAAVLVERNLGRGRIVSLLPARPDYLPLMVNLTVRAARPLQPPAPVAIGDVLSWHVGPSADIEQWIIHRPDGATATPSVAGGAESPIGRYDVTNQPGVYELRGPGRPRFSVVGLDAAESDLRRISDAAWRDRYGDAEIRELAASSAQAVSAGATTELSHLLIFLLVGAVAGELLVTAILDRAT
jgi:hypothetical protein